MQRRYLSWNGILCIVLFSVLLQQQQHFCERTVFPFYTKAAEKLKWLAFIPLSSFVHLWQHSHTKTASGKGVCVYRVGIPPLLAMAKGRAEVESCVTGANKAHLLRNTPKAQIRCRLPDVHQHV